MAKLKWWQKGEKITHSDIMIACKDVKDAPTSKELKKKLEDLSQIRKEYSKQEKIDYDK